MFNSYVCSFGHGTLRYSIFVSQHPLLKNNSMNPDAKIDVFFMVSLCFFKRMLHRFLLLFKHLFFGLKLIKVDDDLFLFHFLLKLFYFRDRSIMPKIKKRAKSNNQPTVKIKPKLIHQRSHVNSLSSPCLNVAR